MRRPTFLRVYSSDATEKADEATPLNRSDSDDVRNSIDNNELHLYTELHNDEQMLMFRPTMAGGPRRAVLLRRDSFCQSAWCSVFAFACTDGIAA